MSKTHPPRGNGEKWVGRTLPSCYTDFRSIARAGRDRQRSGAMMKWLFLVVAISACGGPSPTAVSASTDPDGGASDDAQTFDDHLGSPGPIVTDDAAAMPDRVAVMGLDGAPPRNDGNV